MQENSRIKQIPHEKKFKAIAIVSNIATNDLYCMSLKEDKWTNISQRKCNNFISRSSWISTKGYISRYYKKIMSRREVPLLIPSPTLNIWRFSAKVAGVVITEK